MTRVKATVNVMSAVKASAVDKVNAMFNTAAVTMVHRDAAYASKRSIAKAVMAGGAPPAEFATEATLRSMTPTDLATLILSKPDLTARRELARQKMMLKIEQATTLWQVDAVLANPET